MTARDRRVKWAEIFSALASEPRLQIVGLLARGEVQCQEILKHVNLSQPAVSYHLAKLERAGVLQKERRGSRHCYRLSEDLVSLFRCLMKEDDSWNIR
jgi:DNA-binding transcriptional ArsR family regulator